MFRTAAVLSVTVAALVVGQVPAGAAGPPPTPTPGARGIGDPYFPDDGNGGYDVDHYGLDLRYDPSTDVLSGSATIRAAATQDLSQFDLDLQGLQVRAVTVDGRPATWSRDGQELVVTPEVPLRDGCDFTTRVVYDGVPQVLDEPTLGRNGVFTTDDGMVVAGQPHGASTWYPVNDHPADAASYDVRIAVPEGLQAVANGRLKSHRTSHGWTTWHWSAPDPMASYLSTVAVGHFDLQERRAGGVRYLDAVDPSLDAPLGSPGAGGHYLISSGTSSTYQRLSRTLSVPASGMQLAFATQVEAGYRGDALFVEAAPAGSDLWTTLPDLAGSTTQDADPGCPRVLDLHPFLEHYLTRADDGTCTPSGTSGSWWALSGQDDAAHTVTVDLSAYAGRDVDVSITYASDGFAAGRGAVVDDVTTTTGEGTTSFERDGDVLDGWLVAPAPAGSPEDAASWTVGDADDEPATPGATARTALAAEPAVVDFLTGLFGSYPFDTAGGTVDATRDIQFALETQTRPVYGQTFFDDPEQAPYGDATYVVAHELAHQWTGDDVRLRRWQDIWLNEGFATYAEWAWVEARGGPSLQDRYADVVAIPADDPFWSVAPGDPGPDALFDAATYERGGATLFALRDRIGKDDFDVLLHRWTAERSGQAVTTQELVDLAEQVSGQDLGAFFASWLYTPTKPADAV